MAVNDVPKNILEAFKTYQVLRNKGLAIEYACIKAAREHTLTNVERERLMRLISYNSLMETVRKV